MERGCEKDALFPYWIDADGEERSRCPARPLLEDPAWFNSIISAYNAYKNGFLPYAGGTAKQPALFMFVMSTIDGIMSECDRAEMDRDAKGDKAPPSSLNQRPTQNGSGRGLRSSGPI